MPVAKLLTPNHCVSHGPAILIVLIIILCKFYSEAFERAKNQKDVGPKDSGSVFGFKIIQ